MLLTITNTHPPATDLGYLLHKHPERVQKFNLNFGQAHVFYPEASIDCCTAALMLDMDPVKLVRGRQKPAGSRFSLQQYVNDRPYEVTAERSEQDELVGSPTQMGVFKRKTENGERRIE